MTFPWKSIKHITYLRIAQQAKILQVYKAIELGTEYVSNGVLAKQIHYNVPLNTKIP